MSNIDALDKGLRHLFFLVLNSKIQETKSITKKYGFITGCGVYRYINKVYENGSQHNVLRAYAPLRDGLSPWFDINFRLHSYTGNGRNEQRLVSHNGVIVSWINLEDVYLELFIEEAPNEETSENTKVLIDDEGEVLEYISNEADYFYMRSKELKESDNVPTNSLKAPPKYDSEAYVDKICNIMGGKYD